ncbi:MAG: hypothetical protein KAS18_06855 [Calditrichia bacterium]|nr:hypothetical protein [Calditrichia bacterium]
MRKNKFKLRYALRLEISLLSVLIITILFFYFYPRFEQKFSTSKNLIEPDFIIVDTPRTYQIVEKIKPLLPVIPSQFEEIEFMEDVEIVENEVFDSTKFVDSSLANLLYYEDLLPYIGLEQFDPRLMEDKNEPLDQYREYLNYRLTEIFNNKKSYKSRSNIDDILTQSMGRDPNMLLIDIRSVIYAVNKYINPKTRRNITVQNIIESEKYWYILEVLWRKKTQTIFEIYDDESIRKVNTVASLKKSMNNLKENELVIEIESFERSHYFPSFSPDEMIDIVNKYLARDLTNKHKDILSSFLNFIIMNS